MIGSGSGGLTAARMSDELAWAHPPASRAGLISSAFGGGVAEDHGAAIALHRRRWLALQRKDGGWPVHPRASSSNPHATALALWVILAALEPDAPRVAWIAGR